MNVQMNVRIDDRLKAAGDGVFAKIGLTPTQVVRSVWEFAAAHREAPAIVLEALESPTMAYGLAESERRAGQIEYAGNVFPRMRELFSLQPPDQLEELDYRNMRERALFERMEERGLA